MAQDEWDAEQDKRDREWEEYQRKLDLWLIQTVGLRASVLESLTKDNDWTFIIKIHALIEVALNHMATGIASTINKDKIFPVIERLPIQGRSGKIAFAEAIGVLPKESKKFINLISEARRHLVHDIKNFDFSLSKYLGEMKKEKLEEWKAGLTWNLGSPVEERFKKHAIEWPRFAILQGCMSIMSYSYDARPERWFEEFYGRIGSVDMPPESIPTE